MRAVLTQQILREADLDGQVEEALDGIKMPTTATLTKGIKALFKREPQRAWRNHIETVVTELMEED